MGSQPPLLLAKDLYKSYGPRPALRGLSFSLQKRRILGFLGPNGAGKTTAIRILTTMLQPDTGEFSVAGISSTNPEEIRRKIGVLPESLGFPKNITGLEYLTFFGSLYGQRAGEARKNGLKLLREVGLSERARSLIGSYSHGMRQRLGIARALVNEPEVVFLDEPTLGLDPRGQQELLTLIRRIAGERGAGVILCSHDLPEIEMVCDDVLILNLGKVIASGTVSDVIGRGGLREGTGALANGIRVQVSSASVTQAKTVLEKVDNVSEVSSLGDDRGWLQVKFASLTKGQGRQYSFLNNLVLKALIDAEIPVLGLEREGGRLQDVFLHLTENKKNER